MMDHFRFCLSLVMHSLTYYTMIRNKIFFDDYLTW